MNIFSMFLLLISIWLLAWIFVIYFIYRFYVLFWINKTPILRKFSAKFSSNHIVLGDGYFLESKIYEGNSDVIFITIHGMSGSMTEFIPFAISAQKSGHSVLIWSQRNWGHNQSDSSYHVKTLVDDIHEVSKLILKQYPSKRIVFVGHSLGAMCLGKLMSDYRDFPVDTRFCLINFVTKRFPRISNFSKINFFLTEQLFRGLFFNQNSILRLQPNLAKDKALSPAIRDVIKLDIKKVIPFYFIVNNFSLIGRVVPDLQSNKNNKILLIFGGLDRLQNQNKIKRIAQKFYYTNPNIHLIIHPEMKHLFPKDLEKQTRFYKSIIKFGAVPSIPNIDNSKPLVDMQQYSPNVIFELLKNNEKIESQPTSQPIIIKNSKSPKMPNETNDDKLKNNKE